MKKLWLRYANWVEGLPKTSQIAIFVFVLILLVLALLWKP